MRNSHEVHKLRELPLLPGRNTEVPKASSPPSPGPAALKLAAKHRVNADVSRLQAPSPGRAAEAAWDSAPQVQNPNNQVPGPDESRSTTGEETSRGRHGSAQGEASSVVLCAHMSPCFPNQEWLGCREGSLRGRPPALFHVPQVQAHAALPALQAYCKCLPPKHSALSSAERCRL